jgi:hypothetical protein
MTPTAPQYTVTLGDHEAVAILSLWGFLGFVLADERDAAGDALQMAQQAVIEMGPERLLAIRNQFIAIRDAIFTPGDDDGREEAPRIILTD